MPQDTREERPAPKAVQILITMAPNGGVQVTGPIDNKLLCYGLLDCARDAIKDHSDQKAKGGIVQARQADPFLMRQLGNGANGGR